MREEIKKFAEDMEKVMSEHDDEKGDSWKEVNIENLQNHFANEIEEYLQSGEREELLDIANFCMMLYHRDEGKIELREFTLNEKEDFKHPASLSRHNW